MLINVLLSFLPRLKSTAIIVSYVGVSFTAASCLALPAWLSIGDTDRRNANSFNRSSDGLVPAKTPKKLLGRVRALQLGSAFMLLSLVR